MNRPAVYIGFDPREADAFMVAKHSMRRQMTTPIPIYGVVLQKLRDMGLYTRPTEERVNGDGRYELIDVLSKREDYDGRMSTQHAIARFLVPHLHGSGLALFTDGDVLVRGNVCEMFRLAQSDQSKAVWCVKHDHRPAGQTKMDGQKQTIYARKNWSSVFIINCDHPANQELTVEAVNKVPGRDLHAFYWLDDGLIGDFGQEWNWLVGHSNGNAEPKLVHFTSGTPSMAGYEKCEFADEWRAELSNAAQGVLSLPS